MSSIYRVIVEELAITDAKEYAAFMDEEHQAHAEARQWLADLEAAINSLSEMPRRFKVVPEHDHFEIEVRQFVFHSHRVAFHVDDSTKSVHILRIYHGAREKLKLD